LLPLSFGRTIQGDRVMKHHERKTGPEGVTNIPVRDEYWQRAAAAPVGWVQPPSARTERATPEYDPVFGLSRRAVEQWLANNPGLRKPRPR
jgi:hypothetical protein